MLFHVVLAAIAFAGSSILPPPTVSAQTPPQRVLLVRAGEGVGVDWADELANVLRVEWRARGADVQAPPTATPDDPEDMAGRLAAAWTSYHALQIEEARQALLDVVDRLARRWGRGLDAAQLTDLWLLLAMTQTALGDEAASRAAIERALAITPALDVDLARYPPSVAAQVAESRPRARGTLAVEVAPEGASLVVDGRAVSLGDIELPAGTHWVRAEAPMRVSAGAAVELTEAGELLRLALPIDPALALADLGDLGAPLPSAAQEAVSFLGVTPSMLEIERHDGQLVLLLTDAASGRRASLRASLSDAMRRAPELLEALLEPDSGTLVWPWVLGGSALLVAGAIALGVFAASQESGWNAVATR